MNDDYLWDKSGTPDPEIEELEQLLGNLRYERPAGGLPLPEHAPLRQRRTFTPFLAAAAAVLLMMAAGLWFVFSGGSRKEAAGVLAASIEPGRLPDWLNPESVFALTPQTATGEHDKPEHAVVAVNGSRIDRLRRAPVARRREPPESQVAKAASPTRAERISEDEGVAAREQLIKALHLTSSKLNQVQKKMQDNKSPGPVS
jgi:hypothetical protein